MIYRTLIVASLLAAPTVADDVSPISNARQLTYDGLRSGEGYFSADGAKMVFQSEREPGNPFYQIYLLDLETGDTTRVSPGTGKTTCAWLHPSGGKVLFASTHEDDQAKAKQDAELVDRAAGKQKRYAWDYDERFEIYEKNLKTGSMRKLTDALGYDAEGSYSPDGSKIAFASNRHAYSEPMDEQATKRFGIDKSYMMEIYIADADGSNVKRLTDVSGYDGGPFFSADGKKICWRRFSPEGDTAEIWTMNADGSDQRQLTRMKHMSWAPYFHPLGEYLIFTTNKHGFDNFELYLVDAAGEKDPVRVTDRPGFDGLPAFSPDGKKLAWTSNATSKKQSQIFIADWDHDAAKRLLVASAERSFVNGALEPVGKGDIPVFAPMPSKTAIDIDDLEHLVGTLASDRLAGRMTGTPGEQLATRFVADQFAGDRFAPAGSDGFYQPFDFTAGVSLGEGNALSVGDTAYKVDADWRPLAFSATGELKAAPVAFVGYGIVAPKSDGIDEYDSYVHAEVKGKWVVMFRYMPDDVAPEVRQHMSRYAGIRYKAMVAREKGAAGIVLVSGPRSKVKEQLVGLSFDTSLAGSSIGAISVSDAVAAAWLKTADKDLAKIQESLDKGVPMVGFDLPGVTLAATIDLKQEKRTGRNVIARLAAGDEPTKEVVIIGAHVDHLGKGGHTGSLDPNAGDDAIHPGADDNASGVAAMLEIAQWLAHENAQGKLALKRDIIFAAWSGEELGLLGSTHFAEQWSKNPHAPKIAAYLNMDMVGRYRDNLTLQGVGSSSAWRGLIEKANVPIGLKLTLSDDAYLPTDSTAFYVRDVPVLAAFTGAHEDYHKPTDTADKINYDDLARIAKFMGLLTRQLAMAEAAPDYLAMKRPSSEQRGGLRAYLGTVPDYSGGGGEGVKGLKLSGVAQDGPAQKAGLLGGDVIVELAGRKIENIYDYTYAIEAIKIGSPVKVAVLRGGERKEFEITPASRE